MGDVFTHGHALLIGVGLDLPETVADATALYKIFTDPQRAAYPQDQVALLTEQNATRPNILDEFDKFIAGVNGDPDATALVYYSGHGGELERAHRPTEYFLLPYGYDPGDYDHTALKGLEFTQKIQALKAKKLVVILDSCHAAGVPALKGADQKFTRVTAPASLLEAMDAGSGQVVVTSCADDEASYGALAGSANSLFTAVLLEALAGKAARQADGYARILDVIAYVLDEVPKRAPAPQNPFVNKISGLSKNFALCYYAGGAKSAPGVPPAARPAIAYDSWERHKLESERKALRPAYDLRAEKIGFLEAELPLQFSPLAKFAVMKELAREKADQAEMQARLDEIERALKQLGG